MKKCWVKRRLVKKIGLNAINLIIKSQIGKTKLGGCLKFWHEKIKNGKNLGGYQKFGRKKSPKRKKCGVLCNFGMICKNSAYLPGIFSRPPPWFRPIFYYYRKY